jgi:16S rRNA C967 or C1407 C5-methylase (RsmB/RsmF family)
VNGQDTTADLAAAPGIKSPHIAEAINDRSLDRAG